MKRCWFIWLLSFLMLAVSCQHRETEPANGFSNVPDGTPINITIGFGATAPIDVQVGTKAESSRADESRVHDLYVLIFNQSGACFYGKYFSYQERFETLDDLIQDQANQNEHEGWFVQNRSMDNVKENEGAYISQTTGAVKLSTMAAEGCTLILLANVSNTLTSLSGGDPVTVLNSFKSQNKTLSELENLTVQLEQNVVDRSDLFLMTGKLEGINTAEMIWHGGTVDEPDYTSYNTTYQIPLKHVDAKVKFRVRRNTTNVSSLTPRTWKVYNVPNRCTLFEQETYSAPAGTTYFEIDPPSYFEETVTDEDGIWEVFTFYMLESQLASLNQIDNPTDAGSYYKREKSTKTEDGDYYNNTSWEYAPAKAPYVVFKVSLELKQNAITAGGFEAKEGNAPLQGVSADATFTVHLGEFCTPDQNENLVWDNNNYETHRGRFYTYNVTVNNTTSIYTEVRSFNPGDGGVENQPGQEGSMLLISSGVINCDAHYEYKSIQFKYNETLAASFSASNNPPPFSWYVKTPFNKDKGIPSWNSAKKQYTADSKEIDYLWVKFRINELTDPSKDPDQTTYSLNRQPYPGKDEYDSTWEPGILPVPKLMDINQMINFIYYQYQLEFEYDDLYANYTNGVSNVEPTKSLFDSNGIIEATAFVDEYYYENHPLTGETDPDLWRQFVNADPRELHILSDVEISRDRQSNIINASHSIIQQSIQTIYNVDAPDISSLWGTEHKDEMRETYGWNGWEWGIASGKSATSTENGRLNSAVLWGTYPDPGEGSRLEWSQFLEYDVDNILPELLVGYQKMAYSCLTRNRDNDGDEEIDPEEVRWYLASINQLKGMWIGNEALSPSARVYQPFANDWRAHVISSTCPSSSDTPKVLNAEEGVSTFDYSLSGQSWAGGGASGERLRESVRCLRNIGTYKVGGVDTDISYAPYTQEVDNYYTVEEKTDPQHPTDAKYSDYSIRFYRLNPLSVREFVDKELPFHNELSVNNKVYLELYVQNRMIRTSMDEEYQDGSNTMGDMGDINEDITTAGHNDYCPEGFRLPNQSELAVMTLALPTSFWNSGVRVPSRTYFSKGFYAVGQPKAGEEEKLGWVYTNSNGNVLLPSRDANHSQISKHIRCVRDSEQTGTITGKMHLDKTYFNAGSPRTLYFNFTSAASAFAKVDNYADYAPKLYLCYTDQSGNDVQLDFTNHLNPDIDPLGKMRFNENISITLLQDNISPEPEYPADMQFKLELTNTKLKPEVKAFYTDFTLTANQGEVRTDLNLVPGRDAQLGFPISVSAESNMSSINTLTLYWRKMGQNSYTAVPIPNAAGKASFSEVVYFNPDPLEATTYFFYVSGADENGATGQSKTTAMQVLNVDYHPNPQGAEDEYGVLHYWNDPWWQTFGNANGWAEGLSNSGYTVRVSSVDYDIKQRGYIRYPYGPIKVRDLDFSKGDFIEADIDVSQCVFIKTYDSNSLDSQPAKSLNIGLDNIFSFGKTRIDWPNGATNELHFYYPARNKNGEDMLQMDPVYSGDYSKIALTSLNNKVVLCLEQNGIRYNGNAVSNGDAKYNNVISSLTSSHSLVIGAMEGYHLSRATYNYVRVIHNDIKDIPHDGDTGFTDDPQNGGNL